MKQNISPVKLGNVLTRRKDVIEIDDAEIYKRVTIRLNSGGIVVRDELPGSEIGTKRQFQIETGQVLLSKIDARNGAFGIVPENCDGAIITGNFWAFEPNLSVLDVRYLYYLTKTPSFVEFCIRSSEGTTNRLYLQEDIFLNQEFPLPPLDEQRRIVARIEALAGRVAEAQRLRVEAMGEVSQFISSLHQKLAGDRVVRVDEILELDEVKEPIVDGGSYPQVGVRGFGNGLFEKEAIAADQTSYKHFNCLYEGALVLSQPKGWEGAIAVAGESLAGKFVSPEYRTFRCIPKMASPDYLARLVVTPWFWSKLAQVERGMGGRRQRTRPEQFLALEVSMPTYEEQLKALPVLARMDKIMPIQVSTQTELDALLPAILDQAFRGAL
ncbi:MAG: restriction endonuclease subunit S [Caldilineaceae bacterium]